MCITSFLFPLVNYELLGAGIKFVSTGVVIGNKHDNQIFELSKLLLWKIKIHQLLNSGYIKGISPDDHHTPPAIPSLDYASCF